MALVPAAKTAYELERDARILRNQAFINAHVKEARDQFYEGRQPAGPVRKPRQPKPLPPPRQKSIRTASLLAQKAITAVVNIEHSAEPPLRQPKQPIKMARSAEEPVLETVKDFLIGYAGYSEVDADNPEALQGTLALLSRNTVGLKDILAITDRDQDKIMAQLGSILPDAKPVELTRLARGLQTWRGGGPRQALLADVVYGTCRAHARLLRYASTVLQVLWQRRWGRQRHQRCW